MQLNASKCNSNSVTTNIITYDNGEGDLLERDNRVIKGVGCEPPKKSDMIFECYIMYIPKSPKAK